MHSLIFYNLRTKLARGW